MALSQTSLSRNLLRTVAVALVAMLLPWNLGLRTSITADPSPARAAGGPVVLDGMDPVCHSGGEGTWQYITNVLKKVYNGSGNPGNNGKIAILGVPSMSSAGGCAGAWSTLLTSKYLTSFGTQASGLQPATVFYNTEAELNTFFSTTILNDPPKMLWLPDEWSRSATISGKFTSNAEKIADFVNSGGGLFANYGTYGWLSALYPSAVFNNGGCNGGPNATADGTADFDLTNAMVIACWHGYFTGNVGTLKTLVSYPYNGATQKVAIGGGATSLPSSLVVTGSPASPQVGQNLTITAETKLTDGTVQTGVVVTVTVTSGPGQGTVYTGTSNGAGIATITVPITGAGTSVYTATATVNGVAKTVTYSNTSVPDPPPTVTLTTATINPAQNATVQSTETGTAYLVKSTINVTNLASITGASDNQWNSVSVSSINTNTSLPATGLVSGTYKAYAVDAAGNLSAASSNSVTIDADLPSVTVTRSGSGTVGGGQDVTVTFTLSKSSTTFAAGDVTVSAGTLSNFSGTGTNYTATWTPPVSGSGTASVSVAANKFTDSVGNNNTASATLSIAWNTNLPSVNITRTGAGTVGGGQDITVTFELSEASTNFAVGDITVSGGTLSNFSGSGTIYTVTWTPPSTGSGTANLSVAANKFTDAANNNNAASSPFSIVWNANLPSLEVTRTGTGSVGIGQNLTLTFTLSEASTNFTVGDITVSGGTLSNFSGSGTTYTATWTPPSGTSGSASISVAAGKFTDAAGNSNTASIALTVAYDTVPPTTTTVDPNSTSSSLAQSSGTLAPAVSTPLFPKKSAAKKPTKSSPATTAAPVPTTTTTTIPAPEAPAAELGQAAATIGDEKVETVITRNDNSVVLSMGGLSAMLSGYTSNGSKAALDAEGNLRIARDGKLGMQVKGFKSLSTVEVWLFSDPVKLGDTKTSSAGFAENAFNIPADVPDGRHRAVLSALDPSGDEVTVSLGIIIGADNSSGPSVISILLLIVLSLALILGLALPATLRRLGAEVPRLRIGVRKAQTVTVIDVRGTSEYEFGHLDEALHIENDENFLSRVLELPHDGTYQVYGTGGNNAALAMRQAGFTDVRYLGEIAAAASATGRRIVS